jgi:15-cis-phytoene synthase
MTPEQYVQDKAAKSGSSFYYTFLFLPAQKRAAITAFYAFCREVDDVADEVHDVSVARSKLAWWRNEVHQTFAHRAPTHPVMKALAPHVLHFHISEPQLQGIIDGVEMDLEQTRWLDYAGLQRYCHHVAGLVGIVAASIFGIPLGEGPLSAATQTYADKLGLAFQLTNIIRDVGEDARRGRIYLPLEDLKQFDVKAADIINGHYSDNFTALMRFECERAKAIYRDAYQALPAAERKPQRPGLAMAAIYKTLLDEIERDNFQVLHQRISLTPIRKLWLAWKTWTFGYRP